LQIALAGAPLTRREKGRETKKGERKGIKAIIVSKKNLQKLAGGRYLAKASLEARGTPRGSNLSQLPKN
jgi:hypothetical protein